MEHHSVDTIDLLTLQEAATLLRVNPIWLRRAAKKGKIASIKMDRRLYFKRQDLSLWLQQKYREAKKS